MENTKLELENGCQWFSLTGIDLGTGIEFNADIFGIYENGDLVDSENRTLECESNYLTIAVRNSL